MSYNVIKFHSKLSTWIGSIAYNTCINYYEKKKLILFENRAGNNQEINDALENRNFLVGVDSKNESEFYIFQEDLSKILKTEIELLSPVYKTLITLYHNEELSYEEISQITQMPAGTVKNYLFRARKILKERLLIKYNKEEL